MAENWGLFIISIWLFSTEIGNWVSSIFDIGSKFFDWFLDGGGGKGEPEIVFASLDLKL